MRWGCGVGGWSRGIRSRWIAGKQVALKCFFDGFIDVEI